MKQGKVKFFNESKGYGFIIEDGTNEEFFVHSKDLVDQIDRYSSVRFDAKQGTKGMQAIKVKKL